MNFLSLVTVTFSFFLSLEVFACDLGSVKTADKVFTLSVKISSVECGGAGAKNPVDFYTGDTAALEIKVSPYEAKLKSDITKITLTNAKNTKPKTEPRVRMLSPGLFFADNIEFNTDGFWVMAFTLQRGTKSEIVKLTIPVNIDPHQASKAIKNVKVPNFDLKDPEGRSFSLADMRNKVWVVDFFFTSCPHICPMMTQKMVALQKEFGSYTDFRLVSVTTDPVRDTPVVLADYAKKFKADTKNWFFLRGEKKDVVALSKNGLSLGAESDSIMHSTRFAVVGRDGIVKGTYDSSKREELSELKVVLKEMLTQKK